MRMEIPMPTMRGVESCTGAGETLTNFGESAMCTSESSWKKEISKVSSDSLAMMRECV